MTHVLYRFAVPTTIALGLALPALVGAAEDVQEHETYEKRSMKIETGAAPTTTTMPQRRVYEHHEESETKTIERRSATPPPPPPAGTVHERTREKIETHEDD